MGTEQIPLNPAVPKINLGRYQPSHIWLLIGIILKFQSRKLEAHRHYGSFVSPTPNCLLITARFMNIILNLRSNKSLELFGLYYFDTYRITIRRNVNKAMLIIISDKYFIHIFHNIH